MPKLTPNEVEEVLDALENMIAWGARSMRYDSHEEAKFRVARMAARIVWQKSVAKIDNNKE